MKAQPSHSCQDITALGRCYIEGMNNADKVKPKFKVGDIIIKSQNSDINKFGKFKITGIKDDRYWYNDFVICEINEQDEWELVGIEPKFHVIDEGKAEMDYCFTKMMAGEKVSPAWSDEDEKMCQETIDWFEKKCFPYALEEENPASESIKWLKSLKGRITWKPSEEQMKTLEYYMHTLLATEHKEVLFGLYNDLKKL